VVQGDLGDATAGHAPFLTKFGDVGGMMGQFAGVVLGAEGMFGSMATRILAKDKDMAVVAAGRRDFAVEDGATRLAALLSGRPPGLVVNAIGMLAGAVRADDPASLRAALLINADFPHLLAEVAGSLGWRIVHISTDAVFPANCGLVDEATAPQPEDAYGQTKLLGETRAANALNIRCSIVGPVAGKVRRGLWAWVEDQPQGEELAGFTDQYWSGCTTWQLARLCRRLAEPAEFERWRADGSVLHFAPNPVITKAELIGHLAAVLRPDLKVRGRSSGSPQCRILTSHHPATLSAGDDSDWPSVIAATQQQFFVLKG